ncbi:hypothetical protein FQN55_008323 [Onygenales sp. PD_40]|nr:hypothetical protein FQN55_008323 [Onygenales sp. PD_40]
MSTELGVADFLHNLISQIRLMATDHKQEPSVSNMFGPEVENLRSDPQLTHGLAKANPDVTSMSNTASFNITRREQGTYPTKNPVCARARNPLENMVATEEGWHAAPDGRKLYTKTWKVLKFLLLSSQRPLKRSFVDDLSAVTHGPLKAIVAFVHGFSDHCNAYYGFFPALASHGIEVRAFDQRGWGRSVTDKASHGLTGTTEVVMTDIHSFVMGIFDSLKSDSGSPADTPIFLMGHSMGGAEVLYYALNSSLDLPPLRGVLAYSPLIALHPSTRPSIVTVVLGRLVSKVLPSRQMVQPLNENLICRDKRVCQEWREDSLCHDTGTLEGLAGMLDRGIWLESAESGRSRKFKGPVWVCHGTGDEINSYDASRKFVEVLESQDKTFQTYQGAYHKLHAEPEGVKEALAKDIVEWILKRCESAAPDDPKVVSGEGASKSRL